MSPGSFVSSESAGSSNSLDDPDVEPGSNRLIMTPLDDHVTPGNPLSNLANLAAKLNNTCFSFLVAATIFEESSAESCIEQTGSIERRRSEIASGIGTVNIPQFESRLAVDNAVAAVNQSDDVNYTPIDIIPSSASATGMTSSNSILAASPPGTSTHYTTILAASMASMASNTCSMSKGTLFSKVKISLVISTKFEFSRQNQDALIQENRTFLGVLNPKSRISTVSNMQNLKLSQI